MNVWVIWPYLTTKPIKLAYMAICMHSCEVYILSSFIRFLGLLGISLSLVSVHVHHQSVSYLYMHILGEKGGAANAKAGIAEGKAANIPSRPGTRAHANGSLWANLHADRAGIHIDILGLLRL